MRTTYVLGAGFSAEAGLPLGPRLFSDIVAASRGSRLWERRLEPDLHRYMKFVRRVTGKSFRRDEVNFERFVSFLDIEHHLRLSGKDTWTDVGNESQLVVRNMIAKVLFRKQQAMSVQARQLYDEFARRLDGSDIVITFNYDTVLEDALERVGKKFRLFPSRYASLNEYGGTLEFGDDEVLILKMHGSIDWFDRSHFEQESERWQRLNLGTPDDEVFAFPGMQLEPLVDGLYPTDSPLLKLYRLRTLHAYLVNASFVFQSPVLISPSFSKILYAGPVREFWYSFGTIASWARKLVVVGFSLPQHDEYIQQALYSLIRNFQHVRTGRRFPKASLTLVDYRQSDQSIADYRRTYNFVSWRKTRLILNGFNRTTLPEIIESAG